MNDFVKREYIKAGAVEATVEDLEKLAKSAYKVVRRRVAENSTASAEILACLAKDESPDVRMAVALNSNSSPELVSLLSTDKHPDVRYRIASTSYIARNLLDELKEDSQPYIAHRAKRTISIIETAGPMHTILDYLAEDHTILLRDLHELIATYSETSADKLSEKVADLLDAIATHFSRQERWLLNLEQGKLPPDSEDLKVLLKLSAEDCIKLREKISDFFFQSTEGTDMLSVLQELLKMIQEHIKRSENQLFVAVQKYLPPEDLQSLNHGLQHALGEIHSATLPVRSRE